MIYVTHDQTEAMTLGRPGSWCSIEAVRSRSARRSSSITIPPTSSSPDYRRAEDQSLRGTLEEGARFNLGPALIETPLLAAKTGEKIMLGVRPEHLIIADAGSAALFTSEVALVERLGAETLIYVKPLTGSDLLVIKMSGKTPLKPGARIPVAVKRDSLHFFAADGRRIS